MIWFAADLNNNYRLASVLINKIVIHIPINT